MKRRNINVGKYLFIALIAITCYLSLLFLLVEVESHAPDHSIKNFGDSFWYAFVTLTTLGYGDVLPVTWYGKFIGSIFIFLSIFLLSIVVGRITTQFQQYRERKRMGYYGTTFTNHVIVVGWNEFSKLITEQLITAGKQVAVITDKKNDIDLTEELFPKEMFFMLYSNLSQYDNFDKVNIRQSEIVFINMLGDTEKLVFILNLKRVFPETQFLVTLDESSLKDTFKSAGVTYVLSKNEITSKIIASYIFEPNVAHYTTDLLDCATTGDSEDYDIQEFLVKESNPFVNKYYSEAFINIKKKYNAVTIGISKKDKEGKYKLFKLPPDETVINTGDILILINNGFSSKQIEQDFCVKQGK